MEEAKNSDVSTPTPCEQPEGFWKRDFKRVFLKKDQKQLTEQFRLTLKVSFDLAKEQNKKISSPIKEKIEKLFSQKIKDDIAAWRTAYKIEQYMTYVYDPDTLDIELSRRLKETEGKLEKKTCDLYSKKLEEAAKEENKKRALLLRIVNDLQWFFTNREEIQDYIRYIRNRTLYIFSVSVLIFLASISGLTFFLEISYSLPKFNGHIIDLLLITCCGLAGFMGAAFSFLTGLGKQLENSSIEDLKVMHRVTYIFFRPVIGFGSAVILFFLFQSNLIDGGMIPNIAKLMSKEEGFNFSVLSLLMVWSFIAGFSEKLVPNLLNKTANKLDKSDK